MVRAMEGLRDRAVQSVRTVLEKAGFFVTDTHAVRPTSFDLMARRDSKLLILKVLKNIDALDSQEADQLRELGHLFGAGVLVIGQTSGSTELESGVVYYRYGVSIVNEHGLEEFLLEGVPPFLFSSPGGIFVRVDGGRLHDLREQRNLSLGTLASIAGVSRRTIQLYEGGAGAEVQVVERLEAFLQEPIARAIDLLSLVSSALGRESRESGAAGSEGRGSPSAPDETRKGGEKPPAARPRRTGDPLRDNVFRQLNGMGWDVAVTIRCPFDAFSQSGTEAEREFLLTGVGTLRSAAHRAEVLVGLARVAESHALFVVGDSSNRTDIDGVPLLSARELARQRDRGEFLELLEEREGW